MFLKRQFKTWIPAFAGMTFSVILPNVFAADPELVSVPQGSHQFSPADSLRPSISDNGMVVAFESFARLTAEDQNRIKDIYVFDRAKKSLRLVRGISASYSNAGAALSGDGKTLAFHAVPRPSKKNPFPTGSEIVLVSLDGGDPILIGQGQNGKPQDGESLYPSLSFNGERVLFTSNATNLTSPAKTPVRGVYIFERTTGQMQMASISQAGQPANRPSGYPRLSNDGRLVAFLSAATNLDHSIPLDSLGSHLYLHDMKTGRNTRLDVVERGFDPSEWIPQAFDMDVSANTLVFEARNRDIDNPLKSVGRTALFVYESSSAKITLLTKGIFAGHSRTPSLSADGQYLVFILESDASSEESGGLVVYDRKKDAWKRVVEGVCTSPVVSKDGKWVTFEKKDETITNVYVVSNPFFEIE